MWFRAGHHFYHNITDFIPKYGSTPFTWPIHYVRNKLIIIICFVFFPSRLLRLFVLLHFVAYDCFVFVFFVSIFSKFVWFCSKMRIKVAFEIGHSSYMKSKATPDGFTHDWELSVRGSDGSNISRFVEKVVFNLHESFPRPTRGESSSFFLQ